MILSDQTSSVVDELLYNKYRTALFEFELIDLALKVDKNVTKNYKESTPQNYANLRYQLNKYTAKAVDNPGYLTTLARAYYNN